jgi:gliding motility-associated-like protein
MPVPGCPGNLYEDKNPYWYRFTCYQAGTLGFVINPIDPNDDYDWQMFDITGRNPNDVYTNNSLFVVGNWSGSYGPTGAGPAGINNIECASIPGGGVPTFSRMPTLILGHEYLLMVSHFTDTQIGYSLYFNNGTASITDPLAPLMDSAYAKCDGSELRISLNKKMQCASLDTDGSGFRIIPSLANITAINGYGCQNSFDVDSLQVLLDRPLPPGLYTIQPRIGNDGNSLLDYCGNMLDTSKGVTIQVFAIQPTPMDSLIPVGCAPDTLYLPFKNNIRCSTIAANGSDFLVTGSGPAMVAGAVGTGCPASGTTTLIKVWLNQPIQNAGSYSITLQTGTDGNTIIDECAQETPTAYTLPFTTADTVNADFTVTIGFGCVFDTIYYSHSGGNGVNNWQWTFDTEGVSFTQNGSFLFNTYGNKMITLAVSNGTCTDTISSTILLDNELIAQIAISPSTTLCPEDTARFTDNSVGKVQEWLWTFGDGSTSTLAQPPPKQYPPAATNAGRFYPVSLIVRNDINCYDTSVTLIKVLNNCFIAVPTAFTPNGDGRNDFLYPLNAYKADELQFKVYNRYGQVVFETTDWTRKWDGRINGQPQASGTFVWTLNYRLRDTGQSVSQKGTTILIR